MSSLQWSLLIGAIALIAAVLLLNNLQHWRRRSHGEKTLEALREVMRGRKSNHESEETDDSPGITASDRKPAETPARDSMGLGAFSGPSETLLRASRLEPKLQPIRSNREHVGTANAQRSPGSSLSKAQPSSNATTQPAAEDRQQADAKPTAQEDLTLVESNENRQPAPVTESRSEEVHEPRDEVSVEEDLGDISEPVLDLKQWSRVKPWVGIDERVDLIVGLESWQGWQGERILQAFQGLRRVGTKPLLLEAQVLSDPQEAWVAVVPGLRFVRLRMGLLLANRSGPLKPTEYSDFLSALQSVRDLLQASWTDGTAPANMHEVVDRARRVDAACATLDVQVVINLAVGEAISPAVFAKMGSSLGLVDRGNTRQAMLCTQGGELFSMTLGSKPDWVTFMLDVPRSPMDESPWQKMMDCAGTAVARFGGQLLDDHGQVLEPHQLSDIGKQVLERQHQLIDAGYTPGSPLALRLFN